MLIRKFPPCKKLYLDVVPISKLTSERLICGFDARSGNGAPRLDEQGSDVNSEVRANRQQFQIENI